MRPTFSSFSASVLGKCRFYLAAACVCTLAGCGSREYSPVHGVVTFEGKPVADATVAFRPVGKGPLSTATTAQDGTFDLKLASDAAQSGAKVGSHEITVAAVEVESEGGGLGNGGDSLMDMGREPPKTKSLLPERYGVFETSGLTYDVSAGGDNFAELKLTK